MKAVIKWFSYAIGFTFRLVRPWWIRGSGVAIDKGLRLRGIPHISAFPGSGIAIGCNVELLSSTNSNAMGLNHPVIIRTISRVARIEIGSGTGISGASIVSRLSVKIGSNVLIGANSTIVDTDFHPLDPEARLVMAEGTIESRPVVIGDGAWIGAGAYILKGVNIGKESVVGAGAVVTKDVPARTVVAGNPARPIRKLQ